MKKLSIIVPVYYNEDNLFNGTSIVDRISNSNSSLYQTKKRNFIDTEGYASIIALILMTFGITMLSIGILGEYMWRMFDAARNRPPFIIDEQNEENK